MISRQLGCSKTLASVLYRLDPRHSEPELARAFLFPRLAQLDDPFAITGMDAVVRRIRKGLLNKDRILIFGDYDVDGITSTVSLVHFFRSLGGFPHFVVPRRMNEGYGLSRDAVDRALDEADGVDLFIALDCGTNSVEEVARLRDRGIDVIIVDHHQGKNEAVADCLMVNPHVSHGEADPPPPWLHLCTAGLVFKVIHAMVKAMREEGIPGAEQIKVVDYLDLTTLGTVADLVPLVQENRLLARQGLRRLEATRRPGVHALFESAGLDPAGGLEASDIGFKIGPRINACGRLDDACRPIELLLDENYNTCIPVARELNRMNRERQEIERRITEAAIEMIDANGVRDAAGIVVYHEDWHHGVVGIVASRLTQLYNRPCLVLGAEDTLEPLSAAGNGIVYAKGSGRSIPGLNMVAALETCKDLLAKWGGHPMAVGVTLDVRRMAEFQQAFAAAVGKLCPNGLPERHLTIMEWIEPEDVSPVLMEELEGLHPFGMGNPRPVFGMRGVSLAGPPRMLKNGHFRFVVNGGPRGNNLAGIAWKMADRLLPEHARIDLAVKLTWNTWNGDKSIQLELVDWRLAGR